MTKINTILEAVGEAYEDLRVDYDPPTMYLIAGIAAAGAKRDDLLGAVTRGQPRLDPLVQCKLVDRITARLAEPPNRNAPSARRSADRKGPGGRPAGAEMIHSAAPGRILSVNGRPVR